MASSSQTKDIERPQPGVIRSGFGLGIKFISFLIISLVISIMIEWLGIAFFDFDGLDHAKGMLEREIGYLVGGGESFYGVETNEFSIQLSDMLFFYLFEKTGIVWVVDWLATPNPSSHIWLILSPIYEAYQDYIVGAFYVAKTFFVRLAILILASPAFGLFVTVGIADGLAQRDIRRWSGGRESAFIYHHAKRSLLPLFVAPWFIYLTLPTSIHPNYVILPFAALAGMSARAMASRFKKYL